MRERDSKASAISDEKNEITRLTAELDGDALTALDAMCKILDMDRLAVIDLLAGAWSQKVSAYAEVPAPCHFSDFVANVSCRLFINSSYFIGDMHSSRILESALDGMEQYYNLARSAADKLH